MNLNLRINNKNVKKTLPYIFSGSAIRKWESIDIVIPSYISKYSLIFEGTTQSISTLSSVSKLGKCLFIISFKI